MLTVVSLVALCSRPQGVEDMISEVSAAFISALPAC